MHQNKDSQKGIEKTLKVYLKFMPSEHWERRLLRAFEMLLDDKNAHGLTGQGHLLEYNRIKKEAVE